MVRASMTRSTTTCRQIMLFFTVDAEHDAFCMHSILCALIDVEHIAAAKGK